MAKIQDFPFVRASAVTAFNKYGKWYGTRSLEMKDAVDGPSLAAIIMISIE